MDWIFVGDAHFAPGDGERRERFEQFIKSNRKSLENLVIMGDFFDFWFGFDDLSLLVRQYGNLLDLFRDLRKAGIRIIYVEGNHEFQLGPFMGEELGIEVYENAADIELNGSRVYLAHGDRVNSLLASKLYACLLRWKVSYTVMTWLGPRIVMRIAKTLSTISRQRGAKQGSQIASRLRDFAVRKVREGFDVVVLAHTHVPEVMAIKTAGRVGHYYNVGNWLSHFSYVRYNEKNGFSLEYFGADGKETKRS